MTKPTQSLANSTATTLQVEVTLQDFFFATDSNPVTSATADAATLIDRPIDRIKKVGNSLQGLPIPDQTWEDWMRCWLEHLHSDLPPSQSYELTLRLTDDTEIQAFNAQYRYKDQPTDVLAFAALEVDCPQPVDFSAEQPLYLGDVVISVETAARQAQQQGHALKQELAWLAAHALLHLLGWDHPDDARLEAMLHQQEVLLQQIDLTLN